MNIEYVSNMISHIYTTCPMYTEKKIRNPHKVMLKLYLEIPETYESKQKFKHDLDTIASQTFCTSPENWHTVWRKYSATLSEYFNAEKFPEKPDWLVRMLTRFLNKQDDVDDYSP